MGISPPGVSLSGKPYTRSLESRWTCIDRPAPANGTADPPAVLPGVWLGLVVLAILDATVREALVSPVVGEYWGHVISTVTFAAVLAVVAYRYFTVPTEHSVRGLAAIGVARPALTVAFEFGFGHYVMGNHVGGARCRVQPVCGPWVVVSLAVAVAPALFSHYLKR